MSGEGAMFRFFYLGKDFNNFDAEYVASQISTKGKGKLAAVVSGSVNFVVASNGFVRNSMEESGGGGDEGCWANKHYRKAVELGLPIVTEEQFQQTISRTFPDIKMWRAGQTGGGTPDEFRRSLSFGTFGAGGANSKLVEIINEVNHNQPVPGSLKGETVYPTGTFKLFKDRKAISRFIIACGGLVEDHNVTRKITMLVAGQKGSKVAIDRFRHLKGAGNAAKSIFKEEEFIRLVRTGGRRRTTINIASTSRPPQLLRLHHQRPNTFNQEEDGGGERIITTPDNENDDDHDEEENDHESAAPAPPAGDDFS